MNSSHNNTRHGRARASVIHRAILAPGSVRRAATNVERGTSSKIDADWPSLPGLPQRDKPYLEGDLTPNDQLFHCWAAFAATIGL